MAQYKYRAKKGPTDIVEGTIEAVSEQDAIEKVHALGCIPMKIEEAVKIVTSSSPDRPLPKKIKGRVKSAQVTVFSRQLGSLVRSGVPILNALGIISEQSENQRFAAIINDIRNDIKDGGTLSSTIAKYPRIFPPLYIALIRAGEDSGSLPDALFRIADYRTKQEEMMSRFRMALAYPGLMAIVGSATIIFMLTFVMPRLMKIFTGLNQELPMPTLILIGVSQTLRQWWLPILAVAAAIFAILKKESTTKAGRVILSMIKMKLPLIGNFITKADLSRFSRTLELLVKSGIPILNAIDIAIPVLENEVIKEQLRKSCAELEQGGSFGGSLKSSRLFPPFMTSLIIVGEESGKLDDALSEVAGAYERETDEAMRTMTSLLEPLMILVMGLIVGFIVIAMLLPVFEINVMGKT